MATLQIHASSLDKFIDCPRMAVASSYPGLLKQAGYEVRDTKRFVTPIIGTGIHAGADFLNTDYIKTNVLPSQQLINDACEHAFDKYRSSLLREMESNEVHHTAKFSSPEVIKAHIAEYVHLYARSVLPTRKLDTTEQRFKVRINDEFEYTSTLDSAGEHANNPGTKVLFDLKSGDKITPAYAQIGTYVYLLSTTGYQVQEAQLDYLKRPKDCEPAQHIVIKYDADKCMVLAQYATARLMSDLKAFQESGNINVLLYNPRSTACNRIFCPLFGVEGSCNGWKDK